MLLGAMVLALLLTYWRADPATHLGSFYGNAAADWLGSFVTVVATTFSTREARRTAEYPLC